MRSTSCENVILYFVNIIIIIIINLFILFFQKRDSLSHS